MSAYFCDLLTADDLARLLHRSPEGTARNVSRRPRTLPPFIRVGKTPLWPRHAVEDWLHQNKAGEFPEKFRFFVTMPAAQAHQHQPSLAEMLEAANAHQHNQKNRKWGAK